MIVPFFITDVTSPKIATYNFYRYGKNKKIGYKNLTKKINQ